MLKWVSEDKREETNWANKKRKRSGIEALRSACTQDDVCDEARLSAEEGRTTGGDQVLSERSKREKETAFLNTRKRGGNRRRMKRFLQRDNQVF